MNGPPMNRPAKTHFTALSNSYHLQLPHPSPSTSEAYYSSTRLVVIGHPGALRHVLELTNSFDTCSVCGSGAERRCRFSLCALRAFNTMGARHYTSNLDQQRFNAGLLLRTPSMIAENVPTKVPMLNAITHRLAHSLTFSRLRRSFCPQPYKLALPA